MQDRNINVIAKPPPLREVSSRFIGSVCNFEVLSTIILAERLHPPPDISRAGSPLRGTPLKGRGSEGRSESDSSEERSGQALTRTFNHELNIQPPLTLRTFPLLKKEGRKNSPLERGGFKNQRFSNTGCVMIIENNYQYYVTVGACPDAYWSSRVQKEFLNN